MESVISGDALMIAGQLPARCLSGTAPAAGVATITLATPWDGPNITNAKAVVMPSAALLRQVALEVAQQNASYSSWWSVMEDWQYAMGTVTVDGPAGPREIPTYPQLAADTQGALNGLGTAAAANVTTSDTDVTAGRVTRVGDYGLLGVGPTVGTPNINTLITTGVYFANAGSPGAPTSGAAYLVLVVGGKTIGLVNNRITQVAYTYAGAPIRQYIRGSGDGGATWSAWVENYTTGNVDGVAWTAPTLQNGWTIHATGFAYRVVLGVLYLSGIITAGTKGDGTVVFAIPSGSRPAGVRNVTVGALEAGAGSNARILVYPGGNVAVAGINASHNNVVINAAVRLA
jgi:hypothetical protein